MDKIKVIVCEEGKIARTEEIEDELHIFCDIVGGPIQEYIFEDGVAIVYNEVGNNLPLNRTFIKEGKLNAILGDFFICYAPIESQYFLSLTPELEEKYLDKFKWPEQIFLKNGEVSSAIKYNPDYRAKEVKWLKGGR